MADRKILTRADLERAFSGEWGQKYGPILTTGTLANLLHLPVKTIRLWITKGRFDGCLRKRGKHYRIWRDKALDRYFNGPDWKDE